MKQILLLFNLLFQNNLALLNSWNYLVNGGSYQIPKWHFLQAFTLKTQQLMVIRNRRFCKLWLNGFKHGKQKDFPTAKKSTLTAETGSGLVRTLLCLALLIEVSLPNRDKGVFLTSKRCILKLSGRRLF